MSLSQSTNDEFRQHISNNQVKLMYNYYYYGRMDEKGELMKVLLDWQSFKPLFQAEDCLFQIESSLFV